MKFVRIPFAAALLVAGTAGIALADNATTTTTPSPAQTQAPTGTSVTAPVSTTEAAAPVTPKKSQRVRRAERGTKTHH